MTVSRKVGSWVGCVPPPALLISSQPGTSPRVLRNLYWCKAEASVAPTVRIFSVYRGGCKNPLLRDFFPQTAGNSMVGTAVNLYCRLLMMLRLQL